MVLSGKLTGLRCQATCNPSGRQCEADLRGQYVRVGSSSDGAVLDLAMNCKGGHGAGRVHQLMDRAGTNLIYQTGMPDRARWAVSRC
eukprot:1427480-Amphidinium_carterae.3